MTYSRYTNFILIILAFVRSLFSGKADQLSKLPPKKIVAIVLTSNVGDMIFATTVFRAIKEKYPESHLTVVGSKKNAITLYGNQDVSQYIVTPSSVWTLIKRLRPIKADYGFSLATGSVDIASMFLSGVKSIACFDVKNAQAQTRSYNMLKKLCIQIPFYIGRYCSKEYLRILEPIGIFSSNTNKYLYYDPAIGGKVRTKYLELGLDLKTAKIVAISPGAGTKIKQWPEERFAKIADYVSGQTDFKIAVIGGPGDKEEIASFISNLKDKNFIDAANLSLEELIYFISTCKLLMANDSGPVYMAEAFQVPTIVIVGPTDEFEHPPHGPLNMVVTPKRDQAPAMRGHLVGYDKKLAREQIEQITVEEVLSALQAMLQKIG